MIVKVLGAGCKKCTILEQRLLEIKSNHQLDFEVEKVTRLEDIMAYGVMMTPGLVINDQVKSYGKLPEDKEILKWIREA